MLFRSQQLIREKKDRQDSFLRYEGDTDVEEFFQEESGSEDDVEIAELDYFAEKTKGRAGTSHYL